MLSAKLLLILACLFLGVSPSRAESVPSEKTPETEKQPLAQIEAPVIKRKDEEVTTWDDWGVLEKTSAFGVGIQGRIQEQISQLDGSDLLDDPEGVVTTNKQNSATKDQQAKDRKKLLAELEAMEEKVRGELENESEF